MRNMEINREVRLFGHGGSGKDLDTLLETRASKLQLVLGLVVALTLVATTITFLPHATSRWPMVAPFLPSILSIMFVCEIITAFLLYVQFVASRKVGLLVLAGTYTYSGCIIVPHMLAFPQVFAPTGLFGATPETAVWLWVFWHSGFPVGLGLYGFVSRFYPGWRVRRERAVVAAFTGLGVALALVLGLSILAFNDTAHLVTIIKSGNYQLLVTSGIGPAVWILNLISITVVASRFKQISVIQLGAITAGLASWMDVTLTLFAGQRYMGGWYVARFTSLFASLVLLFILLAAIVHLYRALAHQQSRIWYLAYHDPLTGLANRRHFTERCEALSTAPLKSEGAQPAEQFYAIVMIDLDGFKQVNDQYGHDAGDQLLLEISKRLQQSVREHDLVARLGGDEFIVLITSACTIADIEHIAQRIVDTVQAPIRLTKSEVTVSASVGIALHPNDAKTHNDLVHRADQALYQAKHLGKNRYAFASLQSAET